MRRVFRVAFAVSVSLGMFGCAVSADENGTGQSVDSLEEGHRWKVLNVRYEAQPNGFWH